MVSCLVCVSLDMVQQYCDFVLQYIFTHYVCILYVGDIKAGVVTT
jgi:hypothetical protein